MFKIIKPSVSDKTIHMPDSLIKKLEKLAVKKDVSFSKLVIQCCEYAIEHLKQPNEKE